MKTFLFVAGFAILFLAEIARVYFIMPFPGSQQANTIDLAYYIGTHLAIIRIVGLALIAYPLYSYFISGSKRTKIIVGTLLIIYVVVIYLFNFKFLADKMFIQPTKVVLLDASHNKVSVRQLVIGAVVNGEAKAYPIEIIGYHHQVRDMIGGQPVMVTYCTVCRTGRVYSPEVDGKPENFRLVGMDHFNAMFEDATTKSWWRQVNGEAIAGSLKGKTLKEIPSAQMSLEAWLHQYPHSYILQPDTVFKEQYDGMKNYDEGKSKGKLTKPDSLSWKDKSWVVGVPMGLFAKAYDWHDLKRAKVINDAIEGTPIVVILESDTASFHVWNRIVDKDTLVFAYSDSLKAVVDTKTKSIWDGAGKCTEGPLKNASLQYVQSYQEFWHSWKTFHPQSTQYIVKE